MDKQYNLENRTSEFARNVRRFIKGQKMNVILIEDCKQLVRSSGSIGANYIEANESLSKKDFLMRIKICKKEAKETSYWLRLLNDTCNTDKELIGPLLKESNELMKIFGAIEQKSI